MVIKSASGGVKASTGVLWQAYMDRGLFVHVVAPAGLRLWVASQHTPGCTCHLEPSALLLTEEGTNKVLLVLGSASKDRNDGRVKAQLSLSPCSKHLRFIAHLHST